MLADAINGILREGTWLAVGASVGLLAVFFGIRFGRQIRAVRQLADFSADNDPTRLVSPYQVRYYSR